MICQFPAGNVADYCQGPAGMSKKRTRYATALSDFLGHTGTVTAKGIIQPRRKARVGKCLGQGLQTRENCRRTTREQWSGDHWSRPVESMIGCSKFWVVASSSEISSGWLGGLAPHRDYELFYTIPRASGCRHALATSGQGIRRPHSK